MKQPFWVFAIILLFEIVVVLILIPGDHTKLCIEREMGFIEDSLGIQSKDWVTEKANDWYQSTIIDSGVYTAAYQILIPSENERVRSRGMENMGTAWFQLVSNRIEATFRVVYQFYMRLALLVTWAPYMLILLVPAIFDGMMTRSIKQTNFDYASPIVHRYSVRGSIFLLFGLIMTFFAPLALNPIIIPVVLMITSVLCGTAWANLQKRI